MQLKFSKYHGTGNDFVMVNNLNGELKLTTSTIQQLCNRHTGVGADGVILIEKSTNADFFMNYYNSDGSQSFCGNGSRCAVAFARTIGIQYPELTFHAIDGLHTAKWTKDAIFIHMGDTENPVQIGTNYFINTGSPHIISYQDQVANLDVKAEGSHIRYSDRWKKEGTNVNFVLREADLLTVRTYERGVEDETLSCGTGVTAVALTDAFLHGGTYKEIQTPGGKLRIEFEQVENGFHSIWLIGPAVEVFSGSINLQP